jgi:hypothetical protein
VTAFARTAEAADTNTPAETVSKMYAETWAECSDDARILDYLTVLVAKRGKICATPSKTGTSGRVDSAPRSGYEAKSR